MVSRVKILFVHQNFPGQFRSLAPTLAARGHSVVALTMRQQEVPVWQGVRVLRYGTPRGTTPGIHPWLSDFETKTIRAEACFRASLRLREAGFTPDVIIAHPGWGESLFLKDVWPAATLGIYCEFFYRPEGCDVGFDPEFLACDPGELCRLRLKNLNNLLHFERADVGLSPTRWQAGTFPQPFRDRISVIHDGIDTDRLTPNQSVSLTLNGTMTLTKADEVITFVNRNLEPYRGYHIFMRALPELLRRRPNARVMIVGGDGVSYGAKPSTGTWKARFATEARQCISDMDWARVHFLGNLHYEHFIALLQLSRVHVYLTYPFVLSWSLLEAMSLGCAVVASDTAPVREAVQHNETGRLVDFFDHSALTEAVLALLDDAASRERLGATARAFVREQYDLRTHCLPRQLQWVETLRPA